MDHLEYCKTVSYGRKREKRGEEKKKADILDPAKMSATRQMPTTANLAQVFFSSSLCSVPVPAGPQLQFNNSPPYYTQFMRDE